MSLFPSKACSQHPNLTFSNSLVSISEPQINILGPEPRLMGAGCNSHVIFISTAAQQGLMKQKCSDNILNSQAPRLQDSSSSQVVLVHLTRYADQHPDAPHHHASPLPRTRCCHGDQFINGVQALMDRSLKMTLLHQSPRFELQFKMAPTLPSRTAMPQPLTEYQNALHLADPNP